MFIIPVTDDNLIEWAKLCNELWADNSIEEMLKEFSNGKHRNEYLFQTDGSFVAFISIYIRNDYVEGTNSSPVGYIEGIYVKPKYRNMGIAKKLVEFAKQWCIENKCYTLASDCEIENKDSRLFHNKIGFSEASVNVHFTMNLHE